MVWPRFVRALQGLVVALLSLTANIALFVFAVTSLALIPALGLGFAVFPAVTGGGPLAGRAPAPFRQVVGGRHPIAIPAVAAGRGDRHVAAVPVGRQRPGHLARPRTG
jgi:hypothetical protein